MDHHQRIDFCHREHVVDGVTYRVSISGVLREDGEWWLLELTLWAPFEGRPQSFTFSSFAPVPHTLAKTVRFGNNPLLAIAQETGPHVPVALVERLAEDPFTEAEILAAAPATLAFQIAAKLDRDAARVPDSLADTLFA